MRRRFRDGGADAIPDYELLELVLFRAVPHRDTKPLGKADRRRSLFKVVGAAVRAYKAGARAFVHGDRARAKSPLGRSDAVPRRFRDDQANRRGGQESRDRGPRPHHRRQAGPCELPRPGVDIRPAYHRRAQRLIGPARPSSVSCSSPPALGLWSHSELWSPPRSSELWAASELWSPRPAAELGPAWRPLELCGARPAFALRARASMNLDDRRSL